MLMQDLRSVDPLKFYISVGDERVVRSRLSTIINSRIRSVLGTQSLQLYYLKTELNKWQLFKKELMLKHKVLV